VTRVLAIATLSQIVTLMTFKRRSSGRSSGCADDGLASRLPVVTRIVTGTRGVVFRLICPTGGGLAPERPGRADMT
jgi:hypothetical protein